jgi:hypothetical protein
MNKPTHGMSREDLGIHLHNLMWSGRDYSPYELWRLSTANRYMKLKRFNERVRSEFSHLYIYSDGKYRVIEPKPTELRNLYLSIKQLFKETKNRFKSWLKL